MITAAFGTFPALSRHTKESRRGTLRLMARETTWRAENIKFRLELKVNI